MINMTQDPNERPHRPWEVFGTRDYSEAERAMFAKLEDVVIPLPVGGGITTTFPRAEDVKPVTLAAMAAAMEKVATRPRDLYVFPHSRWGRILDAASPEFRAELEALRESGTIVVSSMLPDEDHAYRIRPPEEDTPWTR